MDIQKAVVEEFERTWLGSPVENSILVSAAEVTVDAKTRGNKLHDHLTETLNLSDGAAQHLIKLVKAELKALNYTPRSAAEARADRILHIRDSSGRRRARKMGS